MTGLSHRCRANDDVKKCKVQLLFCSSCFKVHLFTVQLPGSLKLVTVTLCLCGTPSKRQNLQSCDHLLYVVPNPCLIFFCGEKKYVVALPEAITSNRQDN